MKTVVGLDLGTQGDFSALCRLNYETAERQHYEIPTLHRWPLGTSYTQVGRDVATFLRKPGLGEAELAVDETGVGLAVVELVRREMAEQGVKNKLIGITITGGVAVNRQSLYRWHVAKRQLVSVISAVVHGGRLTVAKGLPEATALIREMSTFKAKINLQTGNESYESWREKDHDDLVLAVALAVWAAERPRAKAGACR